MKTAEEILIRCAFPLSGVTDETMLWLNTLSDRSIIIRAMKEYAQEVAREALKNAAENAETTQTHRSNGIFDVHKTVVDKQSILSENNLPKELL